MSELHPLTFLPRVLPKMWGGRRLETILRKPLPGPGRFGESWEVFDFPPGAVGPDARTPQDDPQDWTTAVVATGPLSGVTLHALVSEHPDALLGGRRPVQTVHGPQFPWLIKFLDAADDLSVQVHPPERYVRAHPQAHLKNECWHVIAADPGSRLLIGVKPGTTRDAFERSIAEGRCESLLESRGAVPGQTHYLPSGTVHALGGGVLAAEVQTPSDTTFRVFDFNRVDASTGRPRTLHVEPALQCIDFDTAAPPPAPPREHDAKVVEAPQFVVSRLVLPPYDSRRFDAGKLRAILVVEGRARLVSSRLTLELPAGSVVVLPACCDATVESQSNTRALLVE